MKCDICNKELEEHKVCKAYSHILCAKHYQQFLKFGHPLDINPKSVADLNDIEYAPEGIWIITYSRRCEESGRCLIDNDDFAPEILKHKWRYWGGRYFTGNKKPIDLARFIMELAGFSIKNKIIDHINNNPADNRKANLRICTQSENCLNKSREFSATNLFKGIHWNEARKAYEIEIRYQGSRVHFTRQKDLADAVYVRYVAETILFKEYRCTKYDAQLKPYLDKCTKKKILTNYVTTKLSQIYELN